MNLLNGAINPHAIEWGPVVIHWYGVIIAVGIFLAVLGEWIRNLLILLFHLFSPAKELPAFFVVIDPFSV